MQSQPQMMIPHLHAVRDSDKCTVTLGEVPHERFRLVQKANQARSSEVSDWIDLSEKYTRKTMDYKKEMEHTADS